MSTVRRKAASNAARVATAPLGPVERTLKTVGYSAGFLIGRLLRGVRGAAGTDAPEEPQPASLPAPRSGVRGKKVHPIAAALLKMQELPDPAQRGPRRPASILSSSSGRCDVRLTAVEDANGFLFGVMFDHMIKAEHAWEAPLRLAERLGHLDVRRIAKMSSEDLYDAIKGVDGAKALHRLPPRMTKSIGAVSRLLVERYDGNVENVWADGLSVRELKARLDGLPGLGEKLVNMTIAILVKDFGRSFTGWTDADIAVDRHVARVFLRTGLVGPSARPRVALRVADLKEPVVRSARELHPSYPVALDLPAYWVGKQWCKAGAPDCTRCPLRTACPQERRDWQLQ